MSLSYICCRSIMMHYMTDLILFLGNKLYHAKIPKHLRRTFSEINKIRNKLVHENDFDRVDDFDNVKKKFEKAFDQLLNLSTPYKKENYCL